MIFVLKILWKLGVGVLFGHLSFSTKQSVGFQSWFSVNILIWIFKHLLHVLSNTVTVTTKGCILQKFSIYHFSSVIQSLERIIVSHRPFTISNWVKFWYLLVGQFNRQQGFKHVGQLFGTCDPPRDCDHVVGWWSLTRPESVKFCYCQWPGALVLGGGGEGSSGRGVKSRVTQNRGAATNPPAHFTNHLKVES